MKRSVALAFLLSSATLLASQTQITPPDNKYTVAQDVELGQKAAAEARQQMPVMRDDNVTSYVQEIGRRLTAAIRPDLRHPEFRYTFEVINVREINAFALPGGPMFVNRGMIEAAKSEGEVAGVMAHELSHVVLRHGTAQASKATKYEIGQVAGAVLGAIIGGGWGQVISQGTQFGLGAAFMRFSREFERQADIEGAHIMARAGYEPREMANMFKTIEKQGGSGGPQWLSDHPNPGDRYDYITREAQVLRVENPIRDTRGFEQVKAHLRQLSPAPTTEQAMKTGAGRTTGTSGRSAPAPTGRVEPPS
jgi:predicted Zn-dependent protease